MNSSENPLCNVQIHNAMVEPSLCFSMMFDHLEKLDILALYRTADICSILSVFCSLTQMVQLSPVEENHEFLVMRKYLQTLHQVGLSLPLSPVDNVIIFVHSFSWCQ